MTWFQQWRQWAAPLPDGPFALAWFALGAYEAASFRREQERQRELMRGDAYFPTPRRAHALDVITRAIDAAARTGAALPWAFPGPFLYPSATEPEGAAALLSPQGWAEVAQTVIERVLKLRHKEKVKALRVLRSPADEPAAAWIAPLRWASGLAVSQHVDAPKAELFFGWPFRFGTFGAAAAKAAEATLKYWPSSRLARAVALGRDEDNCDVLIHVGDSAELVARLMAQPVKVKADLVLLVGDLSDMEVMDERKRLLMSETAAGGIAVVRWTGMEDLVAALNELMNAISHAHTLDIALHEAFPSTLGPLLVWMTDELASLSVRAVAHRLNDRLKSMPPGTTLDLSRLQRPDLIQRPPPARAGAPTPLGRDPLELPSPSHPPTRRLRIRRGPPPPIELPPQAGAVPPDVAFSLPDLSPAEPAPAIVAPEFELRTEAMTFEAESAGASDLVEVAEVVEGALEPKQTEEARATRHLQQRSSIVLDDGSERPALGGFVMGAVTRVVLRIGAAGQGWQSLITEFPVDQLPPQAERHRLRVWLTEPDQLAEPLRGQLYLPRDGDSTECTLEFTPRQAGSFDGRVTVLHHGRVLQTAALRARVLAPQDAWPQDDWADMFAVESDGAPRLEELVGVRQRLGDLAGRRTFGLAFVTNHTATGQPRLVGLSDKRAWIVNTDGAQAMAADINAELSKVALRVADYKDGLGSPDGLKALIKLAQCGAYLKLFLVDEQLDRQGAHSAVAQEEFVQIVSLRSDAAIPFEFIYELDTPDDDAQACPHWQSAVKTGACSGTCPGDASKRVCPMGFWGLRKVIERHHITPELDEGGKEFFLQSEPSRGSPALNVRGPVLLARSHRVTDDALKPVQDKLDASEGVTILPVTSWEDWKTAVETNNPGFILSMPHTDGKGAAVSLEISKKTLKTILITSKHVCPTKESKSPLVALLGCDIASSAESYTKHVAVFRARGAAVVIGTIATVFGDHAAAVAELLSDELLRPRPAPFRLGEVIRDIKRRCLLDKQLMPLCIVAYGDADWLISN